MNTIIFDLDGVLFDTEKYYFQFGMEAMEEMGYEPNKEFILSLRSFAHGPAKKMTESIYGPDFDLESLRMTRRRKLDALYEESGVPVKEGVEETLIALKEQGYEIAAATANPMDRATRLLKDSGLLDYFMHVISAHEVPNGKPSPDVYLDACKKLGKKPEECFAVEDSPNGIRAASDAGCKTIMIVDLTDSDEELDQRIVGKIYHFHDMIQVVRDLNPHCTCQACK